MKIICIGRNYTEHIKELGNVPTESPVIFLKPDSSIIQKREPFFIPDFSKNIQFEVEVLVKINRLGKHIDPLFAKKYYDEIGLGIDFTARDIQSKMKKQGLPWEKSKAFDRSAYIGTFINKSELQDINAIDFALHKNGNCVQKENTSQMLWDIDTLISEVSKFFTLKIGDILFTGTPKGVGKVSKGDILEGYLNQKLNFRVDIK